VREPQEAAVRDSLEHDRARAVAEEDGGAAVAPVQDPREDVASHDERTVREAGGQHPVGLGNRVHEAGAAGREVVGGRVLGSELVGDDRASRREGHVRSDRRDDDEVEVRPLEPGRLERLARGR
jgi:hypothetical protein